MAKKRTKARAGTKKAAKRRAPKRATARSARARKTSPARTRVTGAVSDAASTVLDRLRAWSPSRYSTR